MIKRCRWLLPLILALLCLLSACHVNGTSPDTPAAGISVAGKISPEDIPPFDGKNPFIVIDDNQPAFAQSAYTTVSYERYAPLDAYGRCGTAQACIGRDIMPAEERGSIGQIKPSGWQTVRYDIVDGKYLYNRCHLIGYQLTGENANRCNLITGTRYLNVEGMLPFENMVADYVQETGNHVLYRVTPLFIGEDLVASGVQMEGLSMEDGGEGICFHVYVYNVQPGVTIDYATGESRLDSTYISATPPSAATKTSVISGSTVYLLNVHTKKFHLTTCTLANTIKAENRVQTSLPREKLIEQGYAPCAKCKP